MKKLMGVVFLAAFAVAMVAGFGTPQATVSPDVCAFVQQDATINTPQDVVSFTAGMEMEATTFETQGALRPLTTDQRAIEGSSEYQLNSGSNQRVWPMQIVGGAVSENTANAGITGVGMEVRQCVWPTSVAINNNQWALRLIYALPGSSDSIATIATSTADASYAVQITRMPEVVLAIKVDVVSLTEHTDTA